MHIKSLFDPSKDIYRTIEKVITYGVAQEPRLKAEIAEYVVTDSIEEQLERLLSGMQAAMEMGGENEVGGWISGFYGSGKSSFTKNIWAWLLIAASRSMAYPFAGTCRIASIDRRREPCSPPWRSASLRRCSCSIWPVSR
jgi:hypothetical protein